jgi:enterochelin esterase-like enzyme
MKKTFGITIIGILSLFIISCKSQTNTVNFESKSHTESKLYTDSIYSEYLSEYRKHNIYLPKNFNENKRYSIIYATDGSEIDGEGFFFKESLNALDSLIDNNVIKPVIFIASFSNKKIISEEDFIGLRNYEYGYVKPTRIEDSLFVDRFKNHMLYFKDELITKIENQFNQNLNKEDRYFYGSSAGAGFGISLLKAYPNKIGTYLCFSAYGGDIKSSAWEEGIKYPNLHFQYGSEEPYLKEDADFLKSKYKELDLYSDIKEFEGGHNYKIWDKEFIKTITELLKIE